MLKFIKEKWEDLYSWVDHFWWKNQIDIILLLIFLALCVINTIDYLKYH